MAGAEVQPTERSVRQAGYVSVSKQVWYRPFSHILGTSYIVYVPFSHIIFVLEWAIAFIRFRKLSLQRGSIPVIEAHRNR